MSIALAVASAELQGQASDPDAEALAPHVEAPAIHARRIEARIHIDGRLDESAWTAATPASGFSQVHPDEGRPASEKSEVRVLFDSEALYVGLRLDDAQAPTTRLGRRDDELATDWVAVVLDSYHDHRTAFAFEINPSGVRRDKVHNRDDADPSWDPVWDAAVAVDSAGWTVEMRIPFSQVRFSPGDAQVWGIQIERRLARRGETAVFAFTPSRHPGGIARFGHLRGLQGVRPGRRMEALPYVVTRAEDRDRGANPFRADRSAGGTAGLDLKYRLSSELTLDATLNPDFGQVDADPAEVNLTAIETFFEERRPFFVEGAEIFDFDAGENEIFYSRRIGRAPQLPVPDSADTREAARIIGAAKLSGQTGQGWSVGLLSAVTERVSSRFLSPSGEARSTAEPMTGYSVARVRRAFREGQSSFGVIGTAVNRRLDTDPGREHLHSTGLAGGIDFHHEWAGRTWSVAGFVSASQVRATPAALLRTQQAPWRYAQRPDAGHLRLDSAATSLAGFSGKAELRYRHGRHWRLHTSLGGVTPGYEVSDVGYQSAADRIIHRIGATYSESRPGRLFRQWSVEGSYRNDWNFGGDHVLGTAFVGSSLETTGFWRIEGNAGVGVESLDDRLTRGGPLARRPWDWRVFAGVGSDPRRPVTAYIGVYRQEYADGGWNFDIFGDVEVKPVPALSITVGPELLRGYSPMQYIDQVADPRAVHTFGHRYLFTELRQTVLSINTRVNFTLRPGVTLQTYAQPFVAAVSFDRLGELSAPRTYRIHRYGEDIGEVHPRPDGGLDIHPVRGEGPLFPFHDPDFNNRSLRGNAVLRWEWRPGSTLILVWQQLRDTTSATGDFRPWRDQRALWGAPAENVLMIKVNYWLNL